MKSFITVILIVLFHTGSFAQSKNSIDEIKVGEKVPDLPLTGILNERSKPFSISKNTSQVLILDFWATWCAPCVAMFPKIDSLQQKYGKKVQFLGVTRESKETVVPFLTRLERIKGIKPLKTLVNDSILSKMFYHATIPYYVWIDKNGIVIGTSDRDAITSKNIDDVLSGRKPTFKNRIDNHRKPWDESKPWFVISNRFNLADSTKAREEILKNDMISYSAATHWINDAGGYLHYDSERFLVVNVSLSFLYRFFYTASYYEKPVHGAFDSQKNHSFEIKDPDLLNKITNKNLRSDATDADQVEWGKANGVCYEIVFPKNLTWKEKMKCVKTDLDRYFGEPVGFSTHVEKRKDTAYVLQVVDTGRHLGKSKSVAVEKHDRYFYKQTNLPLSTLISQLRTYFFQGDNYSFLDHTGIDFPVDLELNCDMKNIEAINKELTNYGLKFTKEANEIDVLVFLDSRKKAI